MNQINIQNVQHLLHSQDEFLFLTQQQKNIAQKQIKNIIKIIKRLPCSMSDLLTVLYNRNQIEIENSDEEKEMIEKYILYRVTLINNQAMGQQFMGLAQQIFQYLQKKINEFKQIGTLVFLYNDFEQIVHKKYDNNTFNLHQNEYINQQNVYQETLKDRFFIELLEVFGRLTNHIKHIYQIQKNNQLDACVTLSMERFREDNQKFISSLEQVKSYVKQNQQHPNHPNQREIFISKIINQNKSQFQKQQDLNQLQIGSQTEKLKASQPQPQVKEQKWHHKLLSKADKVMTTAHQLKDKGIQQVVTSFALNMLSSDDKYEQKSLNELPLEQQRFEQYAQNLKVQRYLTQRQQLYIIEILAYQNVKKQKQNLDNNFTSQQKEILLKCLEKPIQQWKQSGMIDIHTIYQSEYINQKYSLLKKQVLTFKYLDQEQADNRNQQFYQQMFLKLILLFYSTFSKDYDLIAKRYLSQICFFIQKDMIQSNRMIYLFGALKIYQSIDLPRTKLLEILHEQRPYRPINHQMSKMSKLLIQNQKYCSSEEMKLVLRDSFIKIKNKLECELGNSTVPEIQLVRLTHCLSRKTITILISGFLSQDTDKYQEWIGALRAIDDSQIYAIKWQSSTAQHMTDYLYTIGKDLLVGSGSYKILGLGGPVTKALSIAGMIYTQYKNNPFTPALEKARITGIYLAELFIQYFQGHFINLAGFSLGTEVLKHIIERLQQRQKLYMLNRIITMGGVADKNQINTIIKKSPIPLNWINLHTENDYLIRYLLKVCYPSRQPIGTNELDKVPGHDISNINVSLFVSGHLDYRKNMYAIARMLNLRDD